MLLFCKLGFGLTACRTGNSGCTSEPLFWIWIQSCQEGSGLLEFYQAPHSFMEKEGQFKTVRTEMKMVCAFQRRAFNNSQMLKFISIYKHFPLNILKRQWILGIGHFFFCFIFWRVSLMLSKGKTMAVRGVRNLVHFLSCPLKAEYHSKIFSSKVFLCWAPWSSTQCT